jgi:tetrahydromethanopterin S-methyltransferase subunit A
MHIAEPKIEILVSVGSESSQHATTTANPRLIHNNGIN